MVDLMEHPKFELLKRMTALNNVTLRCIHRSRWLSTPHRVRVPDPTEASVDSGRLSIAWFQNLSWDAEISNLIECEEALYPPITQGQLFWEREGPQRPGRRTDAQ